MAAHVHRDRVLIPEGAVYVKAQQLARRYQVSTKWIAARAEFLGATPISDAVNSELRYHLATADAYMASRRRSPVRPVRRSTTASQKPKTTRNGAPQLSFR